MFWNQYYRVLSRYHSLRLLSSEPDSLLVELRRKGFGPLRCFLRIASSDPAPYEQVFILEEYHPLVALIEKNKDARHILNIIDAGGNIGLTSLYLKQYYPDAKVVVIEPDESNLRQISRNIAVNRLEGITQLKAGLWKTNAFLSISGAQGDLMHQTALQVSESETPTPLKGVTLGKVADEHGFRLIDLLKMDIEGTEHVLFSDSTFLRTLAERVRYLALEIHGGPEAARSIHRFFSEHDFLFSEASETTFAVNQRLRANQSSL